MNRNDLITALERYLASSPETDEHAGRTLDFVRTHPDCFKRSLTIGHVTASVWLVDADGERVLLTHHRFLDRWLQLGGHMEDGESVAEAAMREAREESGLECVELLSTDVFDVDVHPIPERGSEPAHLHYDVRYVCRTITPTEIVASDESHDLAWIPIARLADTNDSESMLRMARRWLAPVS